MRLANFPRIIEFCIMRFLFLFAIAGLAASPTLAEARGLQRDRDQNAAYRAMQEGRILSLPEIRARVRMPGAEYIGAEFDGRVYRLKYMRGADVIWIDVDARTGRIVGRQ
jgi:hypothetical protein